MSTRKKAWISFGIFCLLLGGSAIVDYPNGPDIRIGKYWKELKVRLGLDLQGGAHLVYDADVSKIAEADQASALEGTRDVIERRVNTFGVSEPVVQTSVSGDKYRVIVELPGVADVQEAIERIGETPLLDFREEVTPEPEPLTEEEQKQIEESKIEAKQRADEVMRRLNAGEDFAKLADEFSDDPGNTDENGAKKGGELGLQDPGVYVAEFKDALEKLQDGETAAEPVLTMFGYHIIRREATQEEKINARHVLFKRISENDLRPPQMPEYPETGLSGEHLKRSEVTFDPNTGEAQVTLTFNDEGKKLFADITKRNVGKRVAIFLDGSPISIPTVQEEIPTGQAVISGSFTLQDAKQLNDRLNAGALPVPISLVEQQTVGATLGRESVERSFIAGLVGFLLVVLFMVSQYRYLGLLASFALIFYGALVLAIFKLWPVTLTLAGVAGFILSIGMAVDANILIFERMKEELRSGKPLGLAIEEGFSRAWLSIRDSNVSSIITCLILAWFGSSLIKGFAITLAIGILVSMFTAITVTRTLIRLSVGGWLDRHRKFLSTGL